MRISVSDLLHEAPVRLAPMASFTDMPFRAVAVRCGSGFTTNEEIDAEALLAGNARAAGSARTDLYAGVVAMQLLGNSADTLAAAAVRLVEAGADIVDINMGCPVPKVVHRGKGAALMKDVAATAQILSAVRRAIDVPLTIKIRGGWDEGQPNAVEVARMAQDVGVDAVTVHPRTRSQRFAGQAPWDIIADVVAAVAIPVTGNGDVTSLAQARAMMAATGCHSVMVGRAALGRPWLFDAAYGRLDDAGQKAYRARVIAEHLDLIEAWVPPREALLQMKKHLAQYGSGRPDARALRAELFAEPSIPALRATVGRQRGKAGRAAVSGTPLASLGSPIL